jgi:hypothetical protein
MPRASGDFASRSGHVHAAAPAVLDELTASDPDIGHEAARRSPDEPREEILVAVGGDERSVVQLEADEVSEAAGLERTTVETEGRGAASRRTRVRGQGAGRA